VESGRVRHFFIGSRPVPKELQSAIRRRQHQADFLQWKKQQIIASTIWKTVQVEEKWLCHSTAIC
jgi:hypothetical protein